MDFVCSSMLFLDLLFVHFDHKFVISLNNLDTSAFQVETFKGHFDLVLFKVFGGRRGVLEGI